MSIQRKIYTSKRTGKTTIRYFAVVFDSKTEKNIYGPNRNYPANTPLPFDELPTPLKKQLIKDEAELIRQVEEGKIVKRGATLPFDRVAKYYFEASKPPVLANSTWKGYQYYYDRYIKEVFGDRAVNKISSIHIQKFINLMREKTKEDGTPAYSTETINKIINVFVNILDYAKDTLKEVTVNEAKYISRGKVKRTKKTVWTDEQVEYFLSLPSVKSSGYFEMICISLMLGPRPSEVCGLEETALIKEPICCLEFERGYDRYGVETDMKTHSSHRSVPIPPELYDIIHKKLQWKQACREKFYPWGDNNFLFVSPHGLPIKPDQYSKAFKRLIEAHNRQLQEYEEEHGSLPAGEQYLPCIPLYNCRHTFSTSAMKQCQNPALIASITGHSVKTLLQNYVQTESTQQLNLISTLTSGKILAQTP